MQLSASSCNQCPTMAYGLIGRLFVKQFALCYRSVVFLSCPVCDIGILWPNGWTDQDETWHAGRPRPQPHCVRWGPSSPFPKGGGAPNFRQMSIVALTAGWIKMPLGMEVGLSPGHFVLDGDPAPPSPKGDSSQFSVRICCGQMAGWIKMSLGKEVGLSPNDTVLGPSSPPPIFVSIVAKRLDRSRCNLVRN